MTQVAWTPSPLIKILSFLSVVPALKNLGYDGIEIPFKLVLYIGAEKVKQYLEQHDMKCIINTFTDNVVAPGEDILWTDSDADGKYKPWINPLNEQPYTKAPTGEELAECFDSMYTSSNPQTLTDLQKNVVTKHLNILKEQVENAYKIFGDRLTHCVCHAMKDSFTFQMAHMFWTDALAWEKENNYTVCYETHRGRAVLYSPWATRDFFLQYPEIKKEIKLTADLSHWINVAETHVNDIALLNVIKFIAGNFYHTHCRVGYDEGPQVSDPRCYLEQTEGHEKWWNIIWQAQLARGLEVSTMIGEHGPPPYQQTDPNTKKPLANIWEVNHWIQLRRQQRFEELFVKDKSGAETDATEVENDHPSSSDV